MAVYTIEWVKNSVGTPNRIRSFAEASAQTFKKGTPVVYDRSDQAVKIASVGTVTATGIALEDASGTAGTMIDVLEFQAGDVYTATISNAGANSTAVHDKTTIGDNYGWLASTETGETTKITVNQANTTDDWFRVIDLDPRDTENTSGGRVLFEVVPAVYLVSSVA